MAKFKVSKSEMIRVIEAMPDSVPFEDCLPNFLILEGTQVEEEEVTPKKIERLPEFRSNQFWTDRVDLWVGKINELIDVHNKNI